MVPNYLSLTAASLATAMIEMNMEDVETTMANEKLYPKKFEHSKLQLWKKSVVNYLDSQLGESKFLLSYIIHPVNINPAMAINEHQALIWSAPLTSHAFVKDNHQVYHILKNLFLDTEGWAWFEDALDGDGQVAYERILAHYEGMAETNRHAYEAEANLKKLYYQDELKFPFQKYITTMKGLFRELDESGEKHSGHQKVNTLLDGIKSKDLQIGSLIVMAHKDCPTNFEGACTLMASQVALMYLTAQLESKKHGIGAVTKWGQEKHAGCGRTGGCGGGRGGRGSRGRGSGI